MLDPSTQFAVSEVPGVLVFRDHQAPARFYAVPSAPRIAADAGGAPQITLLVYRRRGTTGPPLGGQFTVTTGLALAPQEAAALERALAQRLAAEMPAPPRSAPPPPPPVPEVMSPEWLDGEVEMRLTGEIRVSGRPSMAGANECALSLTLDGGQAQDLQRAWEDGLPEGSIAYRVQVGATRRGRGTSEVRSETRTAGPGRARRETYEAAVHVERTEALRHALILQGPVALTKEELRQCVQVLNL